MRKKLPFLLFILLCIVGLISAYEHVLAKYEQQTTDFKYIGKIELYASTFSQFVKPQNKDDYSFLEVEKKLLFLPEPPVIKIEDEFKVRGIFITGWVAGLNGRMEEYIDLTKNTEINSFVIDIKDDTGSISYKSNVSLAQEIKANRRKIRDIKALIQRLKEENIYLIGRVVAFKDPILAKAKTDLALELKKEDTIWKDKDWINPYLEENWEYAVALAKEALDLGFDEIQFDYVRFPALGNGNTQAVMVEGMSKEETINSFLKYAKKELADYNVPISADIFGAVTSTNNDLGIGQRLETISQAVDVISPMVYPSHYANGVFKLPVPEAAPYETIYYSMKDAVDRLSNGEYAKLRPWLQDFSLKHYYGVNEVREQIKALYDLGIEEWLLWNPRSRYTTEAFLPDKEEVQLSSYLKSFE
ncbi:MAG: putative glycoside hydrolase [Halanaerobiales bacterium]|nr:putative glycoside hydrolase [Halanaerobiales bacterium]